MGLKLCMRGFACAAVRALFSFSWIRVVKNRKKREGKEEHGRERGKTNTGEREKKEFVAILAQVAVGYPRRLEPTWNHIWLNQLHILLGRHAGGDRLVPTSDVGAVSSSTRKMKQRRRRWWGRISPQLFR